MNEVYETFTETLKNLVDFDRISIGLVDGDSLRFLAVSSKVPTELDVGVTIPLKKSVAAWVIAHKCTNIENDFTKERQFAVDGNHVRDGLRSAIRVPLMYKGEIFGTLNLTSCRPDAYGEREQKILEQVAGHVAVAVQNALLYNEAKRAYEETRHAYEELNQAQDLMVRSEKLRALGEMAGGVAHDFNNILTVILGRAQLAIETVEDPVLKKSLTAIEQAAIDGATTVRSLQEFTRVRKDRISDPVNVSHMVMSALQMADPRLKERTEKDGVAIEVSTEINEKESVLGDIAELREALINIIFNAVDAMPEGGKISIKAWRNDKQVVISIADTGVGMSDETKGKVFDPFFTTKGPSGVGLGLSMAYGIITRHGGDISVESSLGKGTTFYVKLPLGGEEMQNESSSDSLNATGKARILLVDDDPNVNEVLELMLSQIGYDVTAVSHGQEAITLFKQGNYDLVITDLGMPDVSGWDVAEAVKQRSPETPVVLITGWGVQVDSAQRDKAGVDGVIAKPFSRQTLSDEMVRLLKNGK
jgi:signal transduction histidine kinase